MGPRAFQIISILVGGFKEENSCYFNYTPRLENNSNCTAECIKEVVERLEMYKTASILYQSPKVNEDGSLPLFQFRDVLHYYSGSDHLVQVKNIQDLFTVNIFQKIYFESFQLHLKLFYILV
ncbi:hypothetical protein ACTFIT_000584 [Dictyostelium discoideum]